MDRWQRFWEGQITPLNRSNSASHRAQFGRELSLLFPSDPSSVLEHACGSGELFEDMGFHEVDEYVGADFSQSMVDVFASRHPELELHCARAVSSCSTAGGST